MTADATLDARGLRCPLPVIRMEAALRRLAAGARLEILADDPIAAVDIPHFARAAGHVCETGPSRDGACVFLVTRGEKP
ncbi:MAG: sulfurtransferase TusA family protein [Pseudomonadota bacterium]